LLRLAGGPWETAREGTDTILGTSIPGSDRGLGAPASAGVIGGGALGLAAALRLAQAGLRVTLIEREAELGGLAAGFAPTAGSPVRLEKFYHHIFRTDRAIVRFIEELGLGPRLMWGTPLTATLRNGKAYPMTPIGMLRFGAIPLPARLRLIATLAALKLAPNERPFSGSTAEQWSRRWAGPQVYEALLGPLLRGKFGDRAPDIAMSWLWSRFHERSLSLGYLRGGFQQLYEALGARIEQLGGRLLLNTPVRSISSDHASVSVETDVGTLTFDRLLVTVPQRVFSELAPGIPAQYQQRFPGPDYYGAHVLILALDRPLTSEYWLNVAEPGFPFLVLVEHTNFLPPSDYGGRHLVYLGNYLPNDAPIFRQDESSVLANFLPALKRFNPAFDPSWVKQHWVFQSPFAQPIVTTRYVERLPPHRTPLRGVYYASMAHVYPQDRGQNYSLLLGERMAAMMLEGLVGRGRSV
jgi:protoporphyrinogen oxidase